VVLSRRVPSILLQQHVTRCAYQRRHYTHRHEDDLKDIAPKNPSPSYTAGELKIATKLEEQLKPTQLQVQDISGGCGSMYAVDITSASFDGMTYLEQHQLVNKVLRDEIKTMHGIQIKTKSA